MDGELTYGTCCDPTIPSWQQSSYCRTQGSNQFCATADTITNQDLRDWVCPANPSKCPNKNDEVTVLLESRDAFVFREHLWNQTVPTYRASSWNCKYFIQAARSLVTYPDD